MKNRFFSKQELLNAADAHENAEPTVAKHETQNDSNYTMLSIERKQNRVDDVFIAPPHSVYNVLILNSIYARYCIFLFRFFFLVNNT